MPDLIYLITKWRRQLIALIVIAVVTAGIIVFIQPNEYLGVTTALPMSPLNADRAKLFADNTVEALYSPLGSADELDKIIGTSRLDTIYIAAVNKFNLIDHYNVSSLQKAVTRLKKDSKIYKSEYGELKVKVWDRSNQLAATLAKQLVLELDSIHTKVVNDYNTAAFNTLLQSMSKIADSTKQTKYNELIAQYQSTIESNKSVLSITEPARISTVPDRPHRLQTILAVLFLSIVFGILLAVILERNSI